MTRSIAVLGLALAGCFGGGGERDKDKPDQTRPPAPAHVVPSGTIAGKPFAPTHVLLLDNSDGGKLGFYAVSAREARDRQRCEEPMGSDSEFEITKYQEIAEWQVGKPIESELGNWAATGVNWNAKPKGTARVTLTAKDARAFKVAGTIELAGDGWAFKGPFEGEYCPTKAVERGDQPEPLAGMDWTLAPVSPAALPRTPLQAVIAGTPGPIAHVTVREVGYHDGTRRQRLVFYAAAPPEPCAARPAGGHGKVYSFDKLVKVEGPAFQVDSFSIDLPAAPAAGGALAGNYHHQHGEKRDQIVDADLQVFEPDGYRSWSYSQYYSAAMAIDEATDKEVGARVYLALPDDGKSMLVGAFTALRCPPQE